MSNVTMYADRLHNYADLIVTLLPDMPGQEMIYWVHKTRVGDHAPMNFVDLEKLTAKPIDPTTWWARVLHSPLDE